MRKSNIRKMVAANRNRKAMPGMGAMAKVAKTMGQAPSIPGGTAAPMKKGGSAKKPKMGIAIMIAVGKKKGK